MDLSTVKSIFGHGIAAVAQIVPPPALGASLSALSRALLSQGNDDPVGGVFVGLSTPEQEADKTWLTTLRTYLELMQDEMKKINDPQTTPEGKRIAQLQLYDLCHDHSAAFVNPASLGKPDDQPQNTLPLLAAFGTIWLSVLRDRVFHYKEIVQADPPTRVFPADEAYNAHTSLRAKFIADREKAVNWQRDCYSVEFFDENRDRWGNALPPDYLIRDKSNILSPASILRYADLPSAERACANYQWDATTAADGFASQLDSASDSVRFWAQTQNDQPMPPPTDYVFSCNRIGGGMRQHQISLAELATMPPESRPISDYSQGGWYRYYGPITQIDWWWDGGALKGLQVYYGGQAADLIGMKYGSGDSIKLQDGEAFTYLATSAGDWVDKFAINTNLRKQSGQPARGAGGPFTSVWDQPISNPPADSDTRVAYFGAVTDGDVISQLKVAWRTGNSYPMFVFKEHMVDAF